MSESALAAEDRVRADGYALLARLFTAGPDEAWLAAMRQLGRGVDGPFGEALRGLAAAAAGIDAETAAIEHAELFVGTGRAPVSIYASHYLTDNWKELTLVDLRERLPALGLARQAGVSQPEDHLAALLEVMRHLVLRGSDDASLAMQQAFFGDYLALWAGRFGDAVEAHGGSRFYCTAARLLQVFCAIEADAFGLQS